MNIGAKLKLLRQRCALTQEELGDRCELTKGYISQLENEVLTSFTRSFDNVLGCLSKKVNEFISQ